MRLKVVRLSQRAFGDQERLAAGHNGLRLERLLVCHLQPRQTEQTKSIRMKTQLNLLLMFVCPTFFPLSPPLSYMKHCERKRTVTGQVRESK